MAFSSILISKFSTTHENRFWNDLTHTLQKEYSEASEGIFLIGNIIVEGKELDAILIKDDAIIVIDFKDYGGTLNISENTPWTISGTTINSGRKNPFGQLSDNKYALLSLLDRRLPDGFDNWINLGHINALVLFHQNITYDNSNVKYDLSPSASKWFCISDLSHLIKTINEITTPTTLINASNLQSIIKALGITDVLLNSAPNETEKRTKNEENSAVTEASFSELYYSKAHKLDSIDCIIIGQDPYPSNGNGVAFCKNSHYELFQDGCSGGLVINSLGLSKDQVRSKYKNPKALFLDLLVNKGICFININNQEFKKLSLEDIATSTEETRNTNINLVKKSKKVVLLGKGKTNYYFDNLYAGSKADHILIHPSLNAKTGNENEWTNTWTTNTLEKIINENN